MTASILLARLIGPVLLVAGLTGLFNPKLLKELGREIIAGRALLFLAGILTLVTGLAIVNLHNVWAGWPVIITLFGWIAIVSGIVRIAFQDLTRSLGEALMASDTVLRVAGITQVALGGFLAFKGYI
jgi:uncharacterized protein YjeT (DUF2065 family)